MVSSVLYTLRLLVVRRSQRQSAILVTNRDVSSLPYQYLLPLTNSAYTFTVNVFTEMDTRGSAGAKLPICSYKHDRSYSQPRGTKFESGICIV